MVTDVDEDVSLANTKKLQYALQPLGLQNVASATLLAGIRSASVFLNTQRDNDVVVVLAVVAVVSFIFVALKIQLI